MLHGVTANDPEQTARLFRSSRSTDQVDRVSARGATRSEKDPKQPITESRRPRVTETIVE